MVYNIELTHKANLDELSIFNYISETFGEIYADDFSNKLIIFFHHLSKYPFIERPAKNNPELRVFIFRKKNKIVYLVSAETIIIVRILNQKQKIAARY